MISWVVSRWRGVIRQPLGAGGLLVLGVIAGMAWEAGPGTPLYALSEPTGESGAPASLVPPEAGGKAETKGAGKSGTNAKGKPGNEGSAAGGSSFVIVGPALDVPKEVLNLLDQRKRFLDQREDALRNEAERVADLKRDLESLLDRYEASVKAYEVEQQKQREFQKAREEAAKKKKENDSSAQQATLEAVTKIYEAMPAEEAAARIEKMPAHMAIKVLRSVKSKTAGAILALVRTDKAAKLTEQLFTPPSKP